MDAKPRTPKLGDQVHFILNAGPNAGAHRPAIIVGITNDYTVNLQIFSDGTIKNGDCCPNLFWSPGAIRDDSCESHGTWHYEEY